MAYELKRQWVVKGKFKSYRDGQNFKVLFDKYPLDNELVDLIIHYRDFTYKGMYTLMSDIVKIKIYEEYTCKTVDHPDLDYKAIVTEEPTRPPELLDYIPNNNPQDDLPF